MQKSSLTEISCALQGLVAGLNAAPYAQELAPIIILQKTSYIGTLIGGLVTKVLSSHQTAQSRLASVHSIDMQGRHESERAELQRLE